ncbi:MAG: Peptide synthetase [Acidobacteria bacterium]|nr:Peptide synthetase [Acidobacteriota bacterium]
MSNPFTSLRASYKDNGPQVSRGVRRQFTKSRATPKELLITQMFADRAMSAPESTALKAGARSLTYAELDRTANRLAHYLIECAVGPESIVAICLDRSLDSVICALAVLKAGGAYLPIDPAYPGERLAFMLNDAQPTVVLTKQETSAQLTTGAWRVLEIDREATVIERYSAEAPLNRSTSEDLAYVIYTSGSTGEPKGVEITHGSLMNLISWHQQAFDVTRADRASHLAAVGFDASVWETWPYLAAGASLHLPDEDTRVSPEHLRDWLVAEGITISFLPTVLAERAMTLDWPENIALRFLLTGADTLHSYPPAGLPFAVINNYGPTECTVVSTSGTVEHGVCRDVLPTIGLPIANTKIYILDEQQRQVSEGSAGELYIGGAGVARGYLNRPDLTAEKFIENPFSLPFDKDGNARLYRTGDIAQFLPNGEIAYLGRVDDQIKVMGYRIEPNEIVAVLNRHAEVQESVVVARDIVCSERQLAAYVVLKSEAQLTAEDLRGFLRAELPDYMVPSIFVRLDSLPTTRNGKVDKKSLPAPVAENTLWDEVFTGPRTPLEERLAIMLSTLLGIEAVSVHDNFFLLGGHSLLGTQLIGQIRGAFGVDLALRSLFDAPTIAELAQEVERLLLARVQAMSEDEVLQLLT